MHLHRAVSGRILAIGLVLPAAAPAQTKPDSEAISVVASPAVPGAPTSAPIDETQPTSTVAGAALRALVAPTGNYDDAVRLTPSVIDVAPNGPGLGEVQTLSIRGFTDGQFNVTFDGIPFADSDDFTHHSSAYFAARDLAAVAVDRGPGDAATIGNATFGGTVALTSLDPAPLAGLSPQVAGGSFATLSGGLLADTGKLPGGISGVLDVEGDGSHGALDGVDQRRASVFGKLLIPLGPRSTLTLLANASGTEQGEPVGATLVQIARLGPATALTDDPRSQAYEGYNSSTYRTDIDYAAFATSWSDGASLSDQLYTYGLTRRIEQGLDPNGETPNGTVQGPADVPGQSGRNGLRAWGDILRVTAPLAAHVDLETGFWLERQTNSRFLLDTDRTLDDSPNPILAPVPGVANSASIVRMQRDTLVTAEPYAQLAWHATGALVLTAGLKGAWSDRGIDAPVMEGTRLPTKVERAFGAPLVSSSVRYRIEPAWSVYAQAARGFLAPPLQFFDVTDPATASIQPEQTWNFQAGTVWRSPTLALAADAYEILFTNAVGNRTVGGETVDFDEGNVTYRGLEAEATRAVGLGWSVVGAASLNGAHQYGVDGGASGPAPTTPQATLEAGLLYHRDKFDASLIEHWTGGSYGDVGGTNWIAPYHELDLSVADTLTAPGATPVTLRGQVFNLLDSRKVDGLAGYTVADTTPLFWTQAGLSVFVTATARF